MQARLDCFQISAKLLINTLVALRDDFVWIVDEAAANAGHPSSHASATFAPAHHAFTVAGYFLSCVINFRKIDMFWFSVQSLGLLLHFTQSILLLKNIIVFEVFIKSDKILYFVFVIS